MTQTHVPLAKPDPEMCFFSLQRSFFSLNWNHLPIQKERLEYFTYTFAFPAHTLDLHSCAWQWALELASCYPLSWLSSVEMGCCAQRVSWRYWWETHCEKVRKKEQSFGAEADLQDHHHHHPLPPTEAQESAPYTPSPSRLWPQATPGMSYFPAAEGKAQRGMQLSTINSQHFQGTLSLRMRIWVEHNNIHYICLKPTCPLRFTKPPRASFTHFLVPSTLMFATPSLDGFATVSVLRTYFHERHSLSLEMDCPNHLPLACFPIPQV